MLTQSKYRSPEFQKLIGELNCAIESFSGDKALQEYIKYYSLHPNLLFEHENWMGDTCSGFDIIWQIRVFERLATDLLDTLILGQIPEEFQGEEYTAEDLEFHLRGWIIPAIFDVKEAALYAKPVTPYTFN